DVRSEKRKVAGMPGPYPVVCLAPEFADILSWNIYEPNIFNRFITEKHIAFSDKHFRYFCFNGRILLFRSCSDLRPFFVDGVDPFDGIRNVGYRLENLVRNVFVRLRYPNG